MLSDKLKSFATGLKHTFDLPGDAAPEDQLKGPVSNLVTAVGEVLGINVDTKTEAQLSEYKVRPDMAVYSAGLICGYIELKKPGLGANAPKLKGGHNKIQWEKLKNLPNLIYTDSQEWALYRSGERVGGLVRFLEDPSQAGDEAIDDERAEQFEALIREFLFWKPLVPHKPTELAAYLAPLTRFLRGEVELALLKEDSAVGLLADEWHNFFFPEADNAQFADAYAQTVTYAMLLARLSGAEKLSPSEAAKTLDEGNGLLARTLELLGQPAARDELRVGFELLQRSLEALDPVEFLKTKPDLWLYFYEDFLAAYDPKLRRDYGVYYTPREVVGLQIRLASELLEKRFKKKLGFAEDGVVFLDPAFGTGTYLVAAISHALENVRERSGEGAVAGRATQMAENMYGFEILVGPYAVAHLRLKQAVESAGGSLPTVGKGKNAEKRLKVYLADTLESPFTTPPGGLDLTHKKLTEEREAARKVKQGGDILVCLGNPPYDRQQIEEGDETTQPKGGWVRFGDQGQEKEGTEGKERPIFEDFLNPAKEIGAGGHLKNLYNDYVYFWRWALWRLFEQQNCGGIVTFITASSYLAGPGFVGVREVMRRTFDELWIIDLGGDNLGTRKTPNVFNIQTPVAIAIGVRGDESDPNTPAKASYVKIEGAARNEKLKQLEAALRLDNFDWRDCSSDWHKPLLPVGTGDFFEWPLITDLFPWSHSGAQFKRSWPIGETEEVLLRRWNSLTSANPDGRKLLFKESRDRKIEFKTKMKVPGGGKPSVLEMKKGTLPTTPSPYMYRSFDRQFAIVDVRLGDFLRPSLCHSLGEHQIFLTTLTTEPVAEGPALTAAAYLPDLHHFRGSFGGKDILPLWRDAEASDSNITKGLLDLLSEAYDTPVQPEDLAAYIYALLGGQSYTSRFWSELETPGPRVPITKDSERFISTAKLGRRLIWLHTYGERFKPQDGNGELPTGSAKCVAAVSGDPAMYPESYKYDPIAREVNVGTGRFGPVAPEVWEFEVSGLKVVQSWLGYRMKVRAGRKSSPLDYIRPEHWKPRLTDDFLELLWVLEATLAMEPDLSAALESVVSGPCFRADELPQPSEDQRKAPKSPDQNTKQLSLLNENENGAEEESSSPAANR